MPKLLELSFMKVKDICVANEGAKMFITVKIQDGEDLTFYIDSKDEQKKWSIYCYLLYNIPTYSIPDVSNYHIPINLFKQQIDPEQFNAGKLQLHISCCVIAR